MKYIYQLGIVLIYLLILSLPLSANNLVLDNTALSDIDYSTHMVNIKYDISWENSWRNNGDGTEFSADNWDAVWVFAKYRVSGGDWLHCTLATDGHTAPAGSVIENPSTGSDNRQTGVFVYRNATGFGSNNWDNCKIRWNYGTDNVADDADVEIRVFGIEMCFVPEGDFYLGDGISSGTFRQTGSNVPVLISDAPVVVKCSNTVNDDSQLEGDGILVDGDDGIDEDGTTTISNPDYPTGYKAFYCMKYEITQGQWVDFCNTITSSQASKLWYLNDTDRHGTLGGSYPYYTTTRQDRNKSFLGIVNGMAYSDWAGLRPMTELEFEKACRGSQSAVAREYAWGTNTVCPSVPMTIVGTENGTETISTDVSNGACLYGNNSFIGGDGGIGPLRAGIFARSATDRKSSGATYFGIMEMSGSLWESMGTLGNATGRGFAGSHGDGIMSADGYANISDWPGYISNKNSGATGSGFRGGAYYFQDANYECISHRVHAAYGEPVPYYDGGFRACRSK